MQKWPDNNYILKYLTHYEGKLVYAAAAAAADDDDELLLWYS